MEKIKENKVQQTSGKLKNGYCERHFQTTIYC